MFAHTSHFDDTLRAGGRMVMRGDVYRGGSLVAADVGLGEDASVTIDGSAAVRRTFKGSLVDPALVPLVATDPLSPYGSFLALYMGFRWLDGTEELLPVGIFALETAEPSSDGSVPLSGSDLSVLIAAARFESPYVIPAATNTGTAIYQLISSRLPGLAYSPVSFAGVTLSTVPLTVYQEGEAGGSPWEAAQTLARSDGLEVFFAADGTCTLRRLPDPTVDPVVFEYLSGADSILVDGSVRNTQDSRPARNVFIVAGEGSANPSPIRVTSAITDPANPINVYAVGRRPTWLISPFISTLAQGAAAVAGLAQREAGGGELLTFSAVPHAGHEAGDVVRVASSSLGVDVNVVLASWTLPCSGLTPATYTTLGRRVVVAA